MNLDKYNKLRDQMSSGDILLFSGKGRLSQCIKLFSRSNWSHVGTVLKVADLGVCCFESTTLINIADVYSGEAKRGVMVTLLSERLKHYDGDVGWRQLKSVTGCDKFIHHMLLKFRMDVRDRPYEQDKIEMLKAVLDPSWDRVGNLLSNEADLSSFFCSELVAEALIRCGIIKKEYPANEWGPGDFDEGTLFDSLLAEGYGYGYAPIIMLNEHRPVLRTGESGK